MMLVATISSIYNPHTLRGKRTSPRGLLVAAASSTSPPFPRGKGAIDISQLEDLMFVLPLTEVPTISQKLQTIWTANIFLQRTAFCSPTLSCH